jgi:hypothetical protein
MILKDPADMAGSATGTALSREEIYGSRRERVLSTVAALIAPIVLTWGLRAYPLIDAFDRALIAVGAVAYFAGFLLVLANARRLLPWGEKAPAVKWISVIALPVLGSIGIAGAFLVANAIFDHGPGVEHAYVVAGRRGNALILADPERPGARSLELRLWRRPGALRMGGTVRVTTKPGALGSRWVAAFRVEPAIEP